MSSTPTVAAVPVACDVHALLKNDSSPKPSARYCAICDAFICDECRANWTARFSAFFKRLRGAAA